MNILHILFYILFPSSGVDGYLGCFHFLISINNVQVQIFRWTYVFIYLPYISISGIAGLNGNFMFNILKKSLFSKMTATSYIPKVHLWFMYPQIVFKKLHFNRSYIYWILFTLWSSLCNLHDIPPLNTPLPPLNGS